MFEFHTKNATNQDNRMAHVEPISQENRLCSEKNERNVSCFTFLPFFLPSIEYATGKSAHKFHEEYKLPTDLI